MKFREKKTGEVKHLALERETFVSLTDVDNWYDTYQPGFDDRLLELLEATPNEVRALRRAGFSIERAPEVRTPKQNAASRRRAKRARAIQKARQVATAIDVKKAA